MEQRIIVDTVIKIVFMNVHCFGKCCFVNLLFQFQILSGGRWQEGSACSTGEEVEQINAHVTLWEYHKIHATRRYSHVYVDEFIWLIICL